MTPAALLADLTQRGVRFEVDGERLRCHGKTSVLTPDQTAAIKAHKPALIALLREEEAAISWRVAAMQQQIPSAGPVPFLVAVPGVPAAAGVCLSCGEPFELVGYVQRCRLCTIAVTRALARVQEDIAQQAHPAAA